MTQKKLINDVISEDLKINEITIKSHNYPFLLKSTKKPPDYIYTKGCVELLNTPSAAIVGTRRPSKEGIKAAKKIAKFYGANGFTIVSGLAQGVDSIAMEAAVEIGAPVIGVLPSSLDNIVPKKSVPLAKKILDKNGLLISERMEGSSVRKYHYINRNRIISGISMVVIVVETAAEGGTMHTVNFAKEQVRPILVADLPAEGNIKLKEETYPLISVGY